MALDTIIHAIDLALLGDPEGAKGVLEHNDDQLSLRLLVLLTYQQDVDARRASREAMARHEIGNALSIAQANIEAMADGVLAVTPERLHNICEALKTAGNHLSASKTEPAAAAKAVQARVVDLCDLIETQAAMLQGLANAKNVSIAVDKQNLSMQFQGDAPATAQIVRNALLYAVRGTAPGGSLVTRCIVQGDTPIFEVYEGASQKRRAFLPLRRVQEAD